MICPHIVNVSMMLGSILTWGFLWPYIDAKAGDWYPVGLKEHDFKGLFGYKVSSPRTISTLCMALSSARRYVEHTCHHWPVACYCASPLGPCFVG